MVHVVNASSVLEVLAQVLNYDVVFPVLTEHVLFKLLSLLLPELSLDHERKRVWDLRLAGEHATHKSWSLNAYSVDATEACARIEATLDEALKVDLEVEPDVFEDHARWYPCVHMVSRDIVLAVGVLSATREHHPFLLLVVV